MEWVTTRQNWRHAVDVLGVAPCNETHKICKETAEVLDIYESQAEAARKNNQNSVDRSLQGFNIKKPYLFIRKSEIDLLGISRCISDRIERSLKNSINKTEKKYSKERVEAITHFFNTTNITYRDYSLITGIDRKILSKMVRGKYFEK